MNVQDASIGVRVVRSKGDYVVGRTGEIIEVDTDKKRVRVQWCINGRTWVKVDSVELESVPYEVQTFYEDKYRNRKTGNFPFPKYIKK